MDSVTAPLSPPIAASTQQTALASNQRVAAATLQTSPFCGDGVCNAGETCATCAQDCKQVLPRGACDAFLACWRDHLCPRTAVLAGHRLSSQDDLYVQCRPCVCVDASSRLSSAGCRLSASCVVLSGQYFVQTDTTFCGGLCLAGRRKTSCN